MRLRSDCESYQERLRRNFSIEDDENGVAAVGRWERHTDIGSSSLTAFVMCFQVLEVFPRSINFTLACLYKHKAIGEWLRSTVMGCMRMLEYSYLSEFNHRVRWIMIMGTAIMNYTVMIKPLEQEIFRKTKALDHRNRRSSLSQVW